MKSEPIGPELRLMSVRKLLPVAAAAAVVAVVLGVSWAVGDEKDPRANGAPSGSGAPSPTDAEQLWTGAAPLLQTPDGKLTLCGGSILDSLPPAGCGGALVRGLDPMTVAGAHRFQN